MRLQHKIDDNSDFLYCSQLNWPRIDNRYHEFPENRALFVLFLAGKLSGDETSRV